MLIQFSVKNFLSFRSKQSLSMVAVPRLGKKDNTFVPDLIGEKFPALLKVIAIYGPNASGKSSLIKAMDVVRSLMAPTRNMDNPLPAKAFRFDKSTLDQPSEIEFDFISEKQRYYFSLSFTGERIIKEELIAYPHGKETPLYKRFHTEKGDLYSFGDKFEGAEPLRDAWKNLTGPKLLFISQVSLNSSENITQLRAPYNWLKSGIATIDQDTMRVWANATKTYVKRIPEQAEIVASFLRDIDIPVARLSVDETEETTSNPANSIEEMRFIDKTTKTTLTHSSNLGEADFDFAEESGGTKNLIGFWFPWTTLGRTLNTLAVDELDSSLHPKIVESIVRQHLSNDNKSQLIFTTHDTHLMNAKIIRRDQFWLTERDENAATTLYSVYDFEGREGEDVEKRYFEGRYRALPLLRGNRNG